ncbi:MAG TPA: methyltransferase, partial [Myxococcales bacterium]|nr:methyltransferase [Myxococcales bacterium]
TLRLARAARHVYAVEVEPKLLEVLRDRLAAAEVRNVTPVLGLQGDPLLAKGACDVVLVVNTFHHFPDGVAYLGRLVASLRPGGRIAVVDYHKRELDKDLGPPLELKVAREDLLAAAEQAGLELVDEPAFLPYQYFLVLHPKGTRPEP